MKERLRKIYELAINGVGGERENARATLERLLQKHNLTLDDLLETEKRKYCFRYKDENERKLLYQIIAKVCDTSDVVGFVRAGTRNLRFFTLTPAEYAEVELLYTEYRAALKKEVARLLGAFVQRNNIFPSDSNLTITDLTPEQLEELKRMMQMAGAMEKVPVNHKRLTAAPDAPA